MGRCLLQTSLQRSERLGSQEPTLIHRPPGVVSLDAAEEAIQLADGYGVCDGFPLSESQKVTLRNGLGTRADGNWAATRIADFGPRQGTGKNDKIAARELAGLILFGEKLIIHTAHEFPTANESFLRLVAVFEAWDDLRSKVARIRYANGEQGIELLTGQRLKYRARTGGSGRGFAGADLIVYDEAQHLGREHIAASGPAKLANPNSQTWYAGSGGLVSSNVAWDIRRDAIRGDAGRLAYTEMTGETITALDGRAQFAAPDPTDRDVWYRCIPGLGRWVTEEGVEALYHELGPTLFAREILCCWDEDVSSQTGPIDLSRWVSLTDGQSITTSDERLALDVTPDRSFATIGIAGRRADGLDHVGIRHREPGYGWVVTRAKELTDGHGCSLVVVKGSPAEPFVAELEAAGVPVDVMSSHDYALACQRFVDAVNASEPPFRHRGNPDLASAIAAAQIKPVGDGGFVFSRRSSGADLTPLTTAAVAWASAPPHSLTHTASVFVSLDDY